MLPAGPLMIEHRLIERMTVALDRHRALIDQGREPDPSFLETAIDFFRTYADHCHHGKEEDLLFHKLTTKVLPPPMKEELERLVQDHVRSRNLISHLKDLTDRWKAGDRSVGRSISHTISEIANLYTDHIAREDKQFFPQAMTVLEPQEREEMLLAFQDFDRKLIHQKYISVVEGVERR